MRSEVPSGKRAFAKQLRSNATDAERKLWSVLRGHRLGDLKFRRQVPYREYILDFVCYSPKLVIEVDGGQHSGSRSDELRDETMAADGFRVLRFWNNDVLANPDGVATEIARVVDGLRGG